MSHSHAPSFCSVKDFPSLVLNFGAPGPTLFLWAKIDQIPLPSLDLYILGSDTKMVEGQHPARDKNPAIVQGT